MKKTALKICPVICLVIFTLMAAVSAKAQTQYRAHIPFDFTIGKRIFKAGEYFIDPIFQNSANQAVAIRDALGSRSYILMITVGQDLSKVKTATLVFHQYDTQYSLSVIRTPTFITKLAASTLEERLAKDPTAKQKIVALAKKN